MRYQSSDLRVSGGDKAEYSRTINTSGSPVIYRTLHQRQVFWTAESIDRPSVPNYTTIMMILVVFRLGR